MMKLEYVPLLKLQRELYALPRGYERFNEYIATMVDSQSGDLKLPLVNMNPMGKDHIPALLDAYLAIDADGIAKRAVHEANEKLGKLASNFKVTTVIADDAHGMWTNRYATEFGHLFQTKPLHRRGWLVGTLWTSEEPNPEQVRLEILLTVYRGAFINQHGYAATLGEMMAQEGYARAMAGLQPTLDEDELAYSEAVIEPYLATEDYPIQITCLFGDGVARELGYEPLGLSGNAGLEVALVKARREL